MASTLVKCYANQSTYIDNKFPTTNFSNASELLVEEMFESDAPGGKRERISFISFNTNDKKLEKKQISVSFSICARDKGDSGNILCHRSKLPFVTQDMTYINSSEVYYDRDTYIEGISPDSTYQDNRSTVITYKLLVKNIIDNGIVLLPGINYQTFGVKPYNSTNPPYLEIIYHDIIPLVTDRYPSKFLDKKNPCTFSWKFSLDKEPTYGTVKQASSKFRYRTKGETTYTEVLIEGETNTHTLPENTLTADEIEWQVIVTSDDNIESTQSDWVSVTTVDSIPTCQVVYPNDTFIDGTQDNLFTWSHIIDTGSPQTKYDLQYSTDGTVWVDLSTETTPRESYHVAADTLPAGSIKWRVRTYNTDDVSGEWSVPGSIVIRSAPPVPSIVSIDKKSRPTIQWGSVGQEAFRLTVFQESKTVYETGVVGTNKKQFKLPIYLEDGNYKFELSIINVYGLESKPLIGSLDVLTTKPGVAQLTMKYLENAVKLFIRLNPLVTKAYIMRNAVPIKKITTQTEWIDYNASGSNSYVIRSVDANDNFADSELLWAATEIKRAVIAPVVDTSYILELKVRRDNPITKRGTVDLSGTPKYFAGREYPVFVFSQTTNETKELFYTFRSQAEFDKFKHIVSLRKTILYRDYQNEVFYGVVTSYEFDKDKYGIDVSFQMTKVDYREEISYDMGV